LSLLSNAQYFFFHCVPYHLNSDDGYDSEFDGHFTFLAFCLLETLTLSPCHLDSDDDYDSELDGDFTEFATSDIDASDDEAHAFDEVMTDDDDDDYNDDDDNDDDVVLQPHDDGNDDYDDDDDDDDDDAVSVELMGAGDEGSDDDDGSDDEREYVVQALPNHRGSGRDAYTHFLVHWAGYSAAMRTWEPAGELPPLLITRYLEKVEKEKAQTQSQTRAAPATPASARRRALRNNGASTSTSTPAAMSLSARKSPRAQSTSMLKRLGPTRGW
jgi:hypothetical protein